MANDLQLQVLIKSVADSTGFKITTEQAQKLKGSLDDAAKGQKGLAKETQGAKEQLGGLKESGRGATEMLDGFSRASQGGLQGILGVGQATKGFVNVLRGAVGASGPIGLAITAIGILAGAALLLAKNNQKVTASAEELATASKRAADRAAELEKIRLTKFNNTIEDAVRSSQQLLNNLVQTNALIDKLEQSKAGAQIAAIDANPSLTETEKVAAKQKIQQGLVTGQRAREDQNLTAQQEDAARQLDIRIQAQKDEELRVAALKRKREEIDADKFAREQEIAALSKKQTDLGAKAGLGVYAGLALAPFGAAGTAIAGSNIDNAKKYFAISSQIETLKARQAAATSEDSTRRAGSLDEQIRGGETSLATSRQATHLAGETYNQTVASIEAQRRLNPQIRAQEDAKIAVENQAALRAARVSQTGSVAARDVLSVVENLPGDRSKEQNSAVAARAIEINRAALQQPGIQAGETMAGAVAEAIKEVFPLVTKAFLENLRNEIRGLDAKIQTDIRAVSAENARNQAQTRDLRN